MSYYHRRNDNGPEVHCLIIIAGMIIEVHCCVHLGSGCDTHEPSDVRGLTKIHRVAENQSSQFHRAAENQCSQIFESLRSIL